MKSLPFDPSSKSPQYGLPVRLKWQLWIEIIEVCRLLPASRRVDLLPLR